MRERRKKISIILLALIMTVAFMMTACGGSDKEEEAAPPEESTQTSSTITDETAAEKTVIVRITHKDGTFREEKYTCTYQTLGDLLRTEKLADGIQGAEGFYITKVDGELARDQVQEWWKCSINGEMSQVGVDEIKLQEGDIYELTFTVGYI